LLEVVEVRIKGHIDASWSAWLGGLQIKYTENGDTILTGTVRDQSALFGVLNKLPNLGMQLLSVNSVPASTDNKQGGNKCNTG